MSDKVLVVGPAWVGDMVMAQSLFMTIKAERPDAIIDVLAPAWTIPLLDRMPEVRHAIHLPFERGELDLLRRRRLGRSLQSEGYDQSIVLPNSFKSALIPWFAGIPRRTGWRGEMRIGLLNDRRTLDKKALPRMVERFNALAYDKGRIRAAGDFPFPPPAPRLAVQPEMAAAVRSRLNLARGRPVLALCPGAEFGAAKRWPTSKYAHVAAAQINAGWEVWLFGSSKDAEACGEIVQALDGSMREHCRSLAGQTSLAEAVDLMSLCDAVATNDSGLMHVAAALDRPLVAIYGPTSPLFTPPLGERSRIVSLGLSCSPFFERTCPLGHHNCMNELPPERIVDELARLVPAE